MPADTPGTVEVPRLMLARQAALILQISERGLWSLARDGKIRSCRIGRLVRFDLVDLMDFIQRSKVGGGQ